MPVINNIRCKQETFGVQEDEWSQIYLMPFKCTIEVKMRVFQFKVSHKILFTNDRLYKIKVTDSLTCTFCQAEIEIPCAFNNNNK